MEWKKGKKLRWIMMEKRKQERGDRNRGTRKGNKRDKDGKRDKNRKKRERR